MKEKVVIITGASSGIGRACAIRFAENGNTIVPASRNEEKLEELSRELMRLGVRHLTVRTDVKNEEDCRQLIEKTISTFGRIDVCINNAGISMRALVKDVELNVLKELMDTNFWGTVYCTKYALPHLIASTGCLVGISSILGRIPSPGRSGYCASKYAMEGFLESVRVETMHQGLKVLIVRPGFTASDIRAKALDNTGKAQGNSPLDESKMMKPEEVARHLFRAVTSGRRDLNLSLETKVLVQLQKFFPGWVDRLVYSAMKREAGSPLGHL